MAVPPAGLSVLVPACAFVAAGHAPFKGSTVPQNGAGRAGMIHAPGVDASPGILAFALKRGNFPGRHKRRAGSPVLGLCEALPDTRSQLDVITGEVREAASL